MPIVTGANPHRRPADNLPVTQRIHEDYFDLQLRFSARYAALTGATLSEAVARCTNLRRRLGLWGADGDVGWAAFLDEVGGCSGPADALRIAMDVHQRAPRPVPSPFGCFNYDPPDAQGTLRLHFMPEERHRQTSALAESRLPERRDELRGLFREVRRIHRDVRHVKGLSWLYHVQAYRGLFPQPYLASLTVPTEPLNMNGSSVWGQVLNHRAQLRPGIADVVLAGLRESNVNAPWFAFPLQPLTASCSADHFFESFS